MAWSRGAGTVLVTGATGGVGSMAVAMLARLGFTVAASTGKAEAAPFLRGLGATEIVDRDELTDTSKPLQSVRWAGAVDAVGGTTLAHILATLAPGWRGGRERQRGRGRAPDHRASVHPARCRALRHRLRGHADGAAAPTCGVGSPPI